MSAHEQSGVGALDLVDVPAPYVYVFVETGLPDGRPSPRYHVHVEACDAPSARRVAESVVWACPHQTVRVGLSALIVPQLPAHERCDACASFAPASLLQDV